MKNENRARENRSHRPVTAQTQNRPKRFTSRESVLFPLDPQLAAAVKDLDPYQMEQLANKFTQWTEQLRSCAKRIRSLDCEAN
jgi:hypothetical protein